MSDQFVGEIRMFAGDFAPKGWALCNGQLLSISQNTALFALLGTNYGGDGKNTFALPDLRGRAPMHQGQGDGLTNRRVGEQVGSETVTLLQSEMPAHTHLAMAVDQTGDTNSPQGTVWAQAPKQGKFVKRDTPLYNDAAGSQMSPTALSIAGSSLPHNNRQPYLGVNFIIALQGAYPPRDS
ncbi:tail fiber protein [Brevibacillus nitrificans]|uniref:phage tail protein n=1 Tax=Brevibacillus nitrificans TaxID=651560 RepID=UPI002E1FD9AE|nr:tail fiber protein [Brevibacillus nitrificans]